MARYRTRPTEVEAVLFTGENLEEVQAFCLVNAPSFFQPLGEEELPIEGEITARVWDKLHDTWVGVKPGQYIIKGTKGEFYPCDPDVFATKYEQIS